MNFHANSSRRCLIHAGTFAKTALAAMTLSALLLSGCTTHYRESLKAYRSAEPVPFYQRTLDWAEVETPIPEPGPQPLETIARHSESLPVPEDRAVVVAARVLGVTPERFEVLAKALDTQAARDQAIRNQLAWRDLLLSVTLHSPRVEAARQTWMAALHQYSQAEYLEGLLREYRSFTRYLNLEAGDALQKEMNQSFFPYPSLTAYKGEMIREQVRLAELAWERVLRDVLVEVGSAFFDYQFEHQGAATVQENVKLLEDLINVVQDRYATGLATQPDVLRLQGELERQKTLLLDFVSRQRSRAATLNALLGRPADAVLGRPAAVELPYRAPGLEALTGVAMGHRQELLEQEAETARMEIAIRMGEIMNRPLFSQGYSSLERGMMPDAATGVPAMPFGVEASPPAPRPAYAQAEAYLGEMRQRLGAARATLEQRRLETHAMALAALEQASIAQRQTVLLSDVVLPLDQTAYDISLRSYTVGGTGFIDLLDAERKLIATRLELDESRRDRNVAVLRLALVRGHLEDTDH